MALNPRQEKFCQLYHETGNASQSYEDAYGCAPLIARQNAWRLLTKDGIKDRLAELKGETRQLAALSRAEIVEYLTEAILTPVSDVTVESRLCEEVTDTEHGQKIKMISKTAAIRELNRMCGFYEPEKHEVSADDELKALLQRVAGVKE